MSERRRPPRLRLSVVLLGLLLVISALVSVWVRDLVRAQEARLLAERGAAAGLVLSASVASIDAQLGQLGTAAALLDVVPDAFSTAADRQLALSPAIRALAVLQPVGDGFVVEVAAGPGLVVGEVVDGPRASAIGRAATGQGKVATPVFSDGPDHAIGFAVGAPVAPPGKVVYREVRVVPGMPTRSTASAPFAELKAELYAVPRTDPSQLLLATAARPAPGDLVHREEIVVGDSQWLLVASPNRPLVGSLMVRLPWLVGAILAAGSLLTAGLVEVLARRRDYALGLVDRRTAELRDSMESLELARQEAAAARDTAMEGSSLKSQFLANMSHEIRTPLNGVIGMTGLLMDTRLDDEQREFAETARRSGEALLELINDVLDFSKIEAGRLELETSDFDLGTVVEDVAELFAPVAQRKGLEIVTSTDPDVPAAVSGDPGRVRQIISNLVGNAVKFTDAGEVAVTVSTEPATGPSHLRFSVRDTGVGIDEETQARIFDAFTQADASTTRRYGGTGLGLAISRRLAEMMGGTLGVDSRPGLGSTFWLSLPLEPAAHVPRPPVDRDALAGRRVLIVDDNPTNRTVLERQTAAWGVQPALAADGPAALEALREAARAGRSFDVVLLDQKMLGMDGLAVAAAVAADASLAHPKLVLLTSVGTIHVTSERIAATITKPVRRSQLFNVIASVLGLESRLPFHEMSAPPASDSWLAAAGLRALVAEDNAVNQRVVAAMLGRLGFRVDVVGDGNEAVAAAVHLPYDIVLMDCQMPHLNGYEATAEIRRRERAGVRVPIVALTASAMAGEEERCLAAGMDAYVAKPVRIEDLGEILRSLLVAPAEALAPPEPPEVGPRRGTADLDPAVFEGIRALGDDLLASIVADFRRGTPDDIARLQQGLADADAEVAARAAHRVKGTCLMLGAARMGGVAADIESAARDSDLCRAGQLVPALERSFLDLMATLEASV